MKPKLDQRAAGAGRGTGLGEGCIGMGKPSESKILSRMVNSKESLKGEPGQLPFFNYHDSLRHYQDKKGK
tara:strand:- start:600 stop:809 length:210 start_codon:yes stop_codon:yes gene_type:complete